VTNDQGDKMSNLVVQFLKADRVQYNAFNDSPQARYQLATRIHNAAIGSDDVSHLLEAKTTIYSVDQVVDELMRFSPHNQYNGFIVDISGSKRTVLTQTPPKVNNRDSSNIIIKSHNVDSSGCCSIL
jgi:hypothetical protein